MRTKCIPRRQAESGHESAEPSQSARPLHRSRPSRCSACRRSLQTDVSPCPPCPDCHLTPCSRPVPDSRLRLRGLRAGEAERVPQRDARGARQPHVQGLAAPLPLGNAPGRRVRRRPCPSHPFVVVAQVKFSLAEKTDKRTSDAGGANMWPALRGLAQSACTERACRERACQERACRERACRERVRGGQGRAHSRPHAHARVRAHMRAQRAPAHTRARARAHARVRTTRARAHTHAHARARTRTRASASTSTSTLYPLPSTLSL